MSANARFLNEAKELESRWKRTGLLEGINDHDGNPDRFARASAAVLLENQRLMNELATDTSDVAQFKRISIPLVRRIYPQLIANKIVSVQPLLGPTGLVYYLRFRYSSNKGSVRGQSNDGGFPGDDINSLQQLADGTANLNIFYSSQFVQNETTSTDAGTLATSVYAPLEHTPLFPGTVTGTVYDGSTAIQTFTVSTAGVFSFTSLVSGLAIYAASGTINYNTGEMTLTWTGGLPGSNNMVVSYEYRNVLQRLAIAA